MSSNGKLAASELVEVQPGIGLGHATARAWARMAAAAAAEGITLRVAQGGGYRDLDAQRALKKAGSASGIAVAEPGFQTHGEGDRVDVGSFGPDFGAAGTRRALWLKAHALEYGFVFEFGARDPNHLRYFGSKPPTPTVTIAQQIQENPTMTTAYATTMPAAPAQADIDFLNSLLASGPLVIRAGVGIYALCGDSPGTRANVHISQLDALGNAWAADHAGSLDLERDGATLPKGVRPLAWPHFISTLKAYLTPLTTSAASASVFDDATIQKLATANAVAFFAEQKKAGN